MYSVLIYTLWIKNLFLTKLHTKYVFECICMNQIETKQAPPDAAQRSPAPMAYAWHSQMKATCNRGVACDVAGMGIVHGMASRTNNPAHSLCLTNYDRTNLKINEETNNIFYPLQHGLQKGRSCKTQLIEFIEDWC